MAKDDNSSITSTNSIKSLMLQFFALLVFIFGIAVFMHDTWIKNISVFHSILELACVFIALPIFTSVWYTYHRTVNNYILGFGFLAVAVFDSFHIYYHLKLDLTARTYFDLSTSFWILGRLTEAIVLFVSIHSIRAIKNRWISLFITLIIVIGSSYFIIAHHDLLPVLLTSQGVTPIKNVFEYIVICMYLASVYRIKDKLDDRAIVTYKYIFISLLMSSISEISFTLYTSVNSISWTIGHLLKITSYFYLFKGIFISTVVYSYEKLIESERYKTELLNKLPIAINNYDCKNNLIFSNQKATELMGYTFHELKGLSADQVTSLLHRPEEGKVETLFREMDKFSKSITNEVRVITDKFGNQNKINVDVHKLENGEFIYLFSDAKKDQELEHLQLQTQTIFNSLGTLVVIYDREFKVIMCNNAFEKLTGLSSNNIIGIKVIELYKLLKFIKRPLLENSLNEKSLESPQYEASLISMDGTIKDLILQSSPVRNVDGEVIGSIDILADISNLKQEQQKIIQQEKMAVLGEMSAAILHETKNFLATIKGSSQLLNIIAKEEKVRKYAQKIDNATNEVNNIINNFLSLGKPTTRVISENSLNEVVTAIKGILESSALINKINFETQLHSNSKVLCDKDQIRQVVLNICKNAIEAMSETNNPKISIETGKNKSLDEVFIKITDNGKGISPNEMSKLGTPFFTTKELGTGLGLNICFQIINEHGGKIDIKSEVGKGSAFIITLPRKGLKDRKVSSTNKLLDEVV